MTAHFASAADTAEQIPQREELAPGAHGFISRHDPNCGFVVGTDGVLAVDVRATPHLARELAAAIAGVTDRPVTHVFLTHYHAVRTLGAGAFPSAAVIASTGTADWIAERGEADFKSETDRFPRLFRGIEEIAGLTQATIAFTDRLRLSLGGVTAELIHLGRGHSGGDAVCWLPETRVLYAGDLVENRCGVYAGDAYIGDWITTLERLRAIPAEVLVPGRGAVLRGRAAVEGAIDGTLDFLRTLRGAVADALGQGADLATCYRAAEVAMRPKFGDWPVFDHVLPFDTARMREELIGTEHPTVWTADRDQDLWRLLRG
jgi:glyoxylase-like metal-dependent hydrolase (beta-lactamase superfamily II)